MAGFKVMDWPYIQNPASHLVPVLKPGMQKQQSSVYIRPLLYTETRDAEATVFSVQQRPDIVFIYKSPKVSSKAFLDLLQQIQTKYIKSTNAVLLGDFNIDWTSESFEKHALEKLMTHKLHYRLY